MKLCLIFLFLRYSSSGPWSLRISTESIVTTVVIRIGMKFFVFWVDFKGKGVIGGKVL